MFIKNYSLFISLFVVFCFIYLFIFFLLQELGSLFSNLEMLVGVNQEIMKGLKDDPNGDRTGQTFLGLVLPPPTPNSLHAVIFALWLL
jgi:hypothetical protein